MSGLGQISELSNLGDLTGWETGSQGERLYISATEAWERKSRASSQELVNRSEAEMITFPTHHVGPRIRSDSLELCQSGALLLDRPK